MGAAGTRDETDVNDCMQTTDNLRTNVRFTRDEFIRIKRDETTTGKSIPWLLKTAYFQRGLSAPTLNAETRKAVKRELAYMGNNLNQLTKHVNSGLISNTKEEVEEMCNAFRSLKAFLGLDYGDRKNTL